MKPEFLEILTQRDFLEIAADVLQVYEHRQTKDGISLAAAESPLDDDMSYIPWTHFGKSAGAVQSHIFVTARSFLIRSVQDARQWEAILRDSQESALRGLKKGIEMGYFRRREPNFSQMWNYFVFYYACNLKLPPEGHPAYPRVLFASQGEEVRRAVDREVAQIRTLRLAAEKGRTEMHLVTQDFIARQTPQETAKRILCNRSRLKRIILEELLSVVE